MGRIYSPIHSFQAWQDWSTGLETKEPGKDKKTVEAFQPQKELVGELREIRRSKNHHFCSLPKIIFLPGVFVSCFVFVWKYIYIYMNSENIKIQAMYWWRNECNETDKSLFPILFWSGRLNTTMNMKIRTYKHFLYIWSNNIWYCTRVFKVVNTKSETNSIRALEEPHCDFSTHLRIIPVSAPHMWLDSQGTLR